MSQVLFLSNGYMPQNKPKARHGIMKIPGPPGAVLAKCDLTRTMKQKTCGAGRARVLAFIEQTAGHCYGLAFFP